MQHSFYINLITRHDIIISRLRSHLFFHTYSFNLQFFCYNCEISSYEIIYYYNGCLLKYFLFFTLLYQNDLKAQKKI